MKVDFIPDHAAVVTPNDANFIEAKKLYIGGTGNLRVLTAGGEDVLFSALPVGTQIELQVVRVFATNTTATLIIRMW